MAHDGLSGVPGIVWGTPLAAAAVYLVLYTAFACYEDFYEIQRQFSGGEAPEINSRVDSAFLCVRRFCCRRAADVNDGYQTEATRLKDLLVTMSARADKAEAEKLQLETQLLRTQARADSADAEKVTEVERLEGLLADARARTSKFGMEKGWLEIKLKLADLHKKLARKGTWLSPTKRADEAQAQHRDEDDEHPAWSHTEARGREAAAPFAPPHESPETAAPPSPPPSRAASDPQFSCGIDVRTAMCAK